MHATRATHAGVPSHPRRSILHATRATPARVPSHPRRSIPHTTRAFHGRVPSYSRRSILHATRAAHAGVPFCPRRSILHTPPAWCARVPSHARRSILHATPATQYCIPLYVRRYMLHQRDTPRTASPFPQDALCSAHGSRCHHAPYHARPPSLSKARCKQDCVAASSWKQEGVASMQCTALAPVSILLCPSLHRARIASAPCRFFLLTCCGPSVLTAAGMLTATQHASCTAHRLLHCIYFPVLLDSVASATTPYTRCVTLSHLHLPFLAHHYPRWPALASHLPFPPLLPLSPTTTLFNTAPPHLHFLQPLLPRIAECNTNLVAPLHPTHPGACLAGHHLHCHALRAHGRLRPLPRKDGPCRALVALCEEHVPTRALNTVPTNARRSILHPTRTTHTRVPRPCKTLYPAPTRGVTREPRRANGQNVSSLNRPPSAPPCPSSLSCPSSLPRPPCQPYPPSTA